MKNNKKRIEKLLELYELSIITEEEIEELALLCKKEEIADFNNFCDEFESGLLNNMENDN